jgi:DNA-binding response OmpR family regulator
VTAERTGSRVLIVDDEHVIADTLALICKYQGFQVETAYSGEMALEKADQWAPDVLISDVALGGISGLDAALVICRKYPGCRVILLSGRPLGSDLLDRAKECGQVFEVLLKPVHPETLLRRMQAQA